MPKGLQGFQKGNRIAKGNKPNKTSFKIGHLPTKGMIGQHHTMVARQKMSEHQKGIKKPGTSKAMKKERGERSHNWKGGITPLRKRIRHSFKYRQWRSDVFTRDDFTCVLCGKRGSRLEADHYPKSFVSTLDKYKIQTLEQALDCEELWNINNGRTLCKKCHNKTENYGNRKKK